MSKETGTDSGGGPLHSMRDTSSAGLCTAVYELSWQSFGFQKHC